MFYFIILAFSYLMDIMLIYYDIFMLFTGIRHLLFLTFS